MTDKPRGKVPPATGRDGNLGVDDRGNVTWQWNEQDEELVADDEIGTARRLQALVDPSLDVRDDDDPLDPLVNNGRGLKTGYNPYNSGALGKPAWKKTKDLRELSKWIELRKKMAQKKETNGE